MPDSVRRTIRTLAQVALAAGLTALYGALQGWSVTATKSPSIADVKGAAIYVVFAILMAVVPLAINMLEDKGAIPAYLKSPPSPGANPVPKDANPTPK